MMVCLLSHGWVGQGFSLTVTLKPTQQRVSPPGLDTTVTHLSLVVPVYFNDLSRLSQAR